MKEIIGRYVRPFYGRMAGGFAIKFIGTIMDLCIPYILAHIIDEVIPTRDREAVLWWGLVMLLCSFAAVTGNIFANRRASRVASDVTEKVRHDLFTRIMYLSERQTDSFTKPSLISRMTTDTYNLHQMLGRVQRLGVRAPILLLGGILITFTLDWSMALVLLAILPLLAAIIIFVSRRSIPMYTALQEATDRFVRTVREDIAGVRVIKALSKTGYETERFRTVNKEVVSRERRTGMLMAVINPSMNVLLNLGLVCVIVVGAFRVNGNTGEVGKILAFTTYFTIILNAMISISKMFEIISKAVASAGRIWQVLDTPQDLVPVEEAARDAQGDAGQEVASGSTAQKVTSQAFASASGSASAGDGEAAARRGAVAGGSSQKVATPGGAAERETAPSITFDHVTFSYVPQKEPNLQDISFSLQRGETLGIIGATGAGKSTVIHLLMRLYDADEGRILIDGRDVRAYDPADLKAKFGVVFQNDTIFEETIAGNVTLGREIPETAVREALRLAQAGEFVEEREGREAEALSIRGANLSGGQKQRVLIARALVEKPDILILDDASSALDYQTDAALRSSLQAHFAGTTKVIVAQRVSSIRHADHILVLDDGRMLGYGTHETLMESCPVYREIASSQMGEGSAGVDAPGTVAASAADGAKSVKGGASADADGVESAMKVSPWGMDVVRSAEARVPQGADEAGPAEEVPAGADGTKETEEAPSQDANGMKAAESAPSQETEAAEPGDAEDDAQASGQEAAEARYSRRTIRKLGAYMLRYKWLLALALLLTVTSNAFALIGPRLTGYAIAAIEPGPGAVDFTTVFYYAGLMVVFYVLSSLLSYALQVLMITISRRVVYRMRQDVLEKLLTLPVGYFDVHQTGDTISRISYDIDTVNASLSNDLVQILTTIITVTGALFMMLSISPKLVLVFVVTVPLSMLWTKFITGKTRPLFRARSAKLGQLNGFVEEMISGQKTLRAYGREDYTIARCDVKNKEAVEAYYRAEYYGSIVGPTVNFVNNLSLSLISVFGALLYLAGGIGIGDISSFVLYSRKFSGPINEFANIMSELQSALAAAERVFRLLDEEPEAPDSPDAEILSDVAGEVTGEHISFGYQKDRPVIRDLSFTARPGQLIAIVGHTGAGKTTLINLLMRFYDPDAGCIRVDGHDTMHCTRSSLRQAFAMVLQDTWLFTGSVYENLAYGKVDATREDVEAAAKAAHIDGFIRRLPQGYDTVLTDEGANISKGQKQLLTIARAMLLDTRMLILDEATSNVDTRTEQEIQRAMRQLMVGKTCFVIAHRLSTIRHADLILVVDNGEVVEQGTHETLMQKGGAYRRLYEAQFS